MRTISATLTAKVRIDLLVIDIANSNHTIAAVRGTQK